MSVGQGMNYEDASYAALIRVYRGLSSPGEKHRVLDKIRSLAEFYEGRGDSRARIIRNWLSYEDRKLQAAPQSLSAAVSSAYTTRRGGG